MRFLSFVLTENDVARSDVSGAFICLPALGVIGAEKVWRWVL